MAWFRRAALAVCITSIALVSADPAMAQYAWIGNNGVRQYSDRPPPPDIPTSHILKAPKGAMPVASKEADPALGPTSANGLATGGTPAPDAKPATAAPAAAKPGDSLAQQNAAYEKRRKEAAEQAKKTADEERVAAEKAKRCDDARSYQRTLQSGGRIARTDKNGERYFLSDTDRAREEANVAQVIAECK